MSDLSEDLEGDVEDFEGDADMSEWAVVDSVGEPETQNVDESTKTPKDDTSKEDKTNKTATLVVAKLRGLAKSDKFDLKEISEKSRSSSGNSTPSDSTHTKRSSHRHRESHDRGSRSRTTKDNESADKKEKEKIDHGKSHSKEKNDASETSSKHKKDDHRHSHASETSSKRKEDDHQHSDASKTSSKHEEDDHRHRYDKKTEHADSSKDVKESHSSQSSATKSDSSKRRSNSRSAEETSEEAKVRKLEDDSDILMAIDDVKEVAETSKDVEDKDVSVHVGENVEEEMTPILKEEDLRNIDNMLVEEMMESVKHEIMPQHREGFIVRFSPVELADLAESSVQELIKSQPNLTFYLKRQGKFKKKKGYAEVYLAKLEDVQAFIEKLLEVKLVEHRTEVTINIVQFKKEPVVLSLVAWLNKNSGLLKLRKSGEDPHKRQPNSFKEKFQVEQVPTSSNIAHLKCLFPFCGNIIPPSAKESSTTDSEFKGPVCVYYVNDRWLEAVLDCCSDFNLGGHSLSIQYTRKERDVKPKQSDVKKETAPVQERRGSVQDKAKQGATKDNKSAKDNTDTTGSPKSDTTPTHESPQEGGQDDDISSMTLDVCAGMMESLNKLKQLGTDNPNILKILEMQSQLANLQESLSKSKGQSGSTEEEADPWKISSTDVENDQEPQQSSGEKGSQSKKLSKEERRKQEEEERAEKQRREMEDLQQMIEEADRAERQREERAKRQIELEKQKMKELEEKRKANWARKMIADAKQDGTSPADSNPAAKLEAQRILKSIEDKQRAVGELKTLETDGESKDETNAASEIEMSVKEEAEESVKKEAGEQSDTIKAKRMDSASTAVEIFEALDPLGIQQLGTKSFQAAFGTQDVTAALDGGSKGLFETHSTKESSDSQKTEDDDDGVNDRLAAFEQELQEKGAHASSQKSKDVEMAISPNRTLHNGAPVYSEQECHQMRSKKHTLPWNYYIQVTYFMNRQCPVPECPATKLFKTETSFVDHWEVFHTPNVTMRFCQKCSAYFMNVSELENHLVNRHTITDPQAVQKLASEARVKVVTNPSFRDPGKYLAPIV